MGGTTQYTVNNQMVNATLMNIADSPTNVQLAGNYNNVRIARTLRGRASFPPPHSVLSGVRIPPLTPPCPACSRSPQDPCPRVPIVATGNDFSTLYAPLIRDGRMEKFYWSPTREDRVGVACGIFKEDNVHEQDVEILVDTFPGQSIDFFGALRARVYDDQIRVFIQETGLAELGKRLINSKSGPVQFAKPNMTLDTLLTYGKMLEAEQENVKRVQLADAYLDGAVLAGRDGSSNTEESANFEYKVLSAGPLLSRALSSQAPRPAEGDWWCRY